MWPVWPGNGVDPPAGTGRRRACPRVRFGNSPDIVPGPEDTDCSDGRPWANLSSTPFQMYQSWIHEGGIATPFVGQWPAGISANGALRHQPAQLPDVMATFLELAGVEYPAECRGRSIQPLKGVSMGPTFSDRPHAREVLFWEHEGHRGVYRGRWKLVAMRASEWEPYDRGGDRGELTDAAALNPATVAELKTRYLTWAERCHVIEIDALRAVPQARRAPAREDSEKVLAR